MSVTVNEEREVRDEIQFGVRWFNLNYIKLAALIFIVAKRNSGKSRLVVDILKNIKFSRVFVFAGSVGARDLYEQSGVPKVFIHEEMSNEVLWDIKKTQERLMQLQGKENLGHVAVIIDDLTFNRDQMNLKALKELVMNGRHPNITIIIAGQYIVDLSKSCRGQTDTVFMFDNESPDELEQLRKAFFSQFTKHSFTAVLKGIVQRPFHCLVMHNQEKDPTRRVYEYRAALYDKPFDIGNETYRLYGRLRQLSRPRLDPLVRELLEQEGKEADDVTGGVGGAGNGGGSSGGAMNGGGNGTSGPARPQTFSITAPAVAFEHMNDKKKKIKIVHIPDDGKSNAAALD